MCNEIVEEKRERERKRILVWFVQVNPDYRIEIWKISFKFLLVRYRIFLKENANISKQKTIEEYFKKYVDLIFEFAVIQHW